MHRGVLAARRVLAIRHFSARSRAREQSYQRLYDSIFIELTFFADATRPHGRGDRVTQRLPLLGTFETCRRTLKMSASWGRLTDGPNGAFDLKRTCVGWLCGVGSAGASSQAALMPDYPALR